MLEEARLKRRRDACLSFWPARLTCETLPLLFSVLKGARSKFRTCRFQRVTSVSLVRGGFVELGKVSRGNRLTSTAQARPIPTWTGPDRMKMISLLFSCCDPHRCVVIGRTKRNDDTVPDGLPGVGFTGFPPVPYFSCLIVVTGSFPTCRVRLLANSVWQRWRGHSNELPLRLIFVLH